MQIPNPTRWINVVIVLGEEAVRWIFRKIRGGHTDEY